MSLNKIDLTWLLKVLLLIILVKININISFIVNVEFTDSLLLCSRLVAEYLYVNTFM